MELFFGESGSGTLNWSLRLISKDSLHINLNCVVVWENSGGNRVSASFRGNPLLWRRALFATDLAPLRACGRTRTPGR